MKNYIIVLFLCMGIVFPTYSMANIRNTPVVQAVKKAAPYVVSINVTYISKESGSETSRVGSGVIFNGRKGYIVTTAHVLKGATKISVYLPNGMIAPAKVLNSHNSLDIAVLGVQAKKLPTQNILGTSSDLMPGETVISIGNPYGFENTVTVGVISAVSRSVETNNGIISNLIQTDAAINPGNSGGPLINLEGKVIAINTIIDTRAEGIGFAIPIDKVKYIVQNLIAQKKIPAVWVGFDVAEIDKNKALLSGIKRPVGVYVSHIHESSPAERFGIVSGDTIMRINGHTVTDIKNYEKIMNSIIYPKDIDFTILRKNQQLAVSLTPTVLGTEQQVELLWKLWGIRLRNENNMLRVINVSPLARTFKSYFQVGDVITHIAGKQITTTSDLYTQLEKYKSKENFTVIIARDTTLQQLQLRKQT